MARTLKLRLYIAGDGPNSMRALANLKVLCDARLTGKHSLEIVDVFREPERALTDGVLVTPTLVKLAPKPVRKVVGTLSDPEPVLRILGLHR